MIAPPAVRRAARQAEEAQCPPSSRTTMSRTRHTGSRATTREEFFEPLGVTNIRTFTDPRNSETRRAQHGRPRPRGAARPRCRRPRLPPAMENGRRDRRQPRHPDRGVARLRTSPLLSEAPRRRSRRRRRPAGRRHRLRSTPRLSPSSCRDRRRSTSTTRIDGTARDGRRARSAAVPNASRSPLERQDRNLGQEQLGQARLLGPARRVQRKREADHRRGSDACAVRHATRAPALRPPTTTGRPAASSATTGAVSRHAMSSVAGAAATRRPARRHGCS